MAAVATADNDWVSLAYHNPIAYELAFDPLYLADDVHYLIASALKRVVDGHCKRLMIFVPPQHGKSRLVSENLPAYYHGHHPHRNIIHLAYSAEFAIKFGRANRNKLLSQEHHLVFGHGLAKDSRSVTKYNTEHGGAYIAQGIRGGITGNPADLIIIDDPIKNKQEVSSEAIMTMIRDNLDTGVRTRMHKDTAIIVMHTRWGEADPAGYLLEQWAHENWEVLSLPALIETAEQAANDPLGRAIGEPLWKTRFPADYLQATKKILLPTDWNALYQQAPNPGEGELFSRSDFNWYEPGHLPKRLNIYGAHDGAVATPEDSSKPDFTELGIWGVDQEFNLYALDWWQCQWDLHEWGETLLDMAEDWKVKRWISEKGVIMHASQSFLRRRKKERGLNQLSFKWLPHVGDKEANVAAFRALVKQGRVFLPRGERWAEALVDQLVRFPGGKYDDKVDNCGFIGRHIGDMMAAQKPRKGRALPRHGTMDWLLNMADLEVETERRRNKRPRRNS